MDVAASQGELAIPECHPITIREARGVVVERAAYSPEVAYEQLRLESIGVPEGQCSQNSAMQLLRAYNEKNGLRGAAAIRPSSPLEEYELSKSGKDHEAFENTFERNGKPYVLAATNMILSRPENGEYKETLDGRVVWRRNVYAFDGHELAMIAEGQPIPEQGTIIGWDEALGLPIETTQRHDRTSGEQWYFYFNAQLGEVAIIRDRLGEPYHFLLRADYEPSYSARILGFRAVSGSAPSYKRLAGIA